MSGPGDTLRLVHALRNYAALRGATDIQILTTTPLDRLRYLFDASSSSTQSGALQAIKEGIFTWSHCPGHNQFGTPSGVNTAMLNKFTQKFSTLAKLNNYGQPLRAHLGAENAASSIPGVRIDRIPQYMSGRLVVPQPRPIRRSNARHVALFVRQLDGSPLNTPTWVIDATLQAAEHLSTPVQIYGTTAAAIRAILDKQLSLKRRQLWVRTAVNTHNNKSYSDQVLDLAENAICAIGINSGGLDLASAGGVPTLRIGEYQAQGFFAEPRTVCQARTWGKSYNSFLARALNIGLEPAIANFEHLPREATERSILTFIEIAIQCRHTLQLPIHATLDHGISIGGSSSALKSQLDRFGIGPPGHIGCLTRIRSKLEHWPARQERPLRPAACGLIFVVSDDKLERPSGPISSVFLEDKASPANWNSGWHNGKAVVLGTMRKVLVHEDAILGGAPDN